MDNPFTKHPNSINETYFQHLKCALTFGVKCLIAGFAVIIHSFLPFLFEFTASNIVKKLNDQLQNRINCKNNQ